MSRMMSDQTRNRTGPARFSWLPQHANAVDRHLHFGVLCGLISESLPGRYALADCLKPPLKKSEAPNMT